MNDGVMRFGIDARYLARSTIDVTHSRTALLGSMRVIACSPPSVNERHRPDRSACMPQHHCRPLLPSPSRRRHGTHAGGCANKLARPRMRGTARTVGFQPALFLRPLGESFSCARRCAIHGADEGIFPACAPGADACTIRETLIDSDTYTFPQGSVNQIRVRFHPPTHY